MTEECNTPECCPAFDPAPWENQTHVWVDRLFLKDAIPTIFHIPVPGKMARMMKRFMDKAEASGVRPGMDEYVLLSWDPTPWKSVFLMSVTGEVAGEEMVRLSGTYLTKVFDGPYKDVPVYLKKTKQYLESQGKQAKQFYFYYTTCPKCAKKYGHNYIVVFAEL